MKVLYPLAGLRGLGALLAVLVMLASGCSEVPHEPLRIASSPWPGYEPLYLARDLGYFDPAKVNLFELPSSDITMESFRNHSTDLATLTLDETLELLHDGMPVRILSVMDISNGADAVMVRPEIKALADIKGKRVSIVNIPLGLYMLNRLLDKAGLERQDISVFPMSESKQEQFYKDGKADVIITFEPVKTKLLEAGAHVLFDSSQIPNEIFDLLIAHEDVYLQRRDDICAVIGAWNKTRDYMTEHEQDAAQRITRRLGLKVDDYAGLLDGIVLPSRKLNVELLGGEAPRLLEPAKRLALIMLKEQQLSRPVDVSPAIDAGFAPCLMQ